MKRRKSSTHSSMFKKILIANRGEIALRIIRTCRVMNLKSVAIYSDADRASLHVMMADEAFNVGRAPSLESYLHIERILDIVKKSKAEAVHPGYGFLSESADFASAVEEMGVTFIGASPQNIKQMGDKITARKLMKESGVPVVPGSQEAISSLEEAKHFASQIGYPLMIKASAGGGGRGIRIVHKENQLPYAFQTCYSEGKKYFNDGSLFLEKFIQNPKHIEVQVFCDQHGNAVHMFDRECSLQRRHQKIIEEAPSPALPESVRKNMCHLATKAVKRIGYRGAGTLEFVFDQDSKEFFFIEMNTRLQVEHAVTEMIIGKDLVQEQIQVAAGKKLSMKQRDLHREGHAIELRVCAEDPITHAPSPGKIRRIRHPQGPFIRVDSYAYPGYEIPIHYDPMFTKLIVWGQNRESCIIRLRGALREFNITGLKTNVVLHKNILSHKQFLDASYTTQFIDKLMTQKTLSEQTRKEQKREFFIFVDEHIFLISAAIEAYRHGRHFDVSHQNLGNQWKKFGRMQQLRK